MFHMITVVKQLLFLTPGMKSPFSIKRSSDLWYSRATDGSIRHFSIEAAFDRSTHFVLLLPLVVQVPAVGCMFPGNRLHGLCTAEDDGPDQSSGGHCLDRQSSDRH